MTDEIDEPKVPLTNAERQCLWRMKNKIARGARRFNCVVPLKTARGIDKLCRELRATRRGLLRAMVHVFVNQGYHGLLYIEPEDQLAVLTYGALEYVGKRPGKTRRVRKPPANRKHARIT